MSAKTAGNAAGEKETLPTSRPGIAEIHILCLNVLKEADLQN